MQKNALWKNRIEYTALKSVAQIIQKLSSLSSIKLGRMLGLFVYYFVPIRKSVAINNIKLAFPGKSDKEIERIARGTYENFGQTFFEFLHTPAREPGDFIKRCRIYNKKLLYRSFESGKGTLLMSGHFGNWEYIAALICSLGFPLTVIARPQKNRLVDNLINKYRQKAGIETVSLGMGVREFLRALRANKFVALLADQDAHREGVFVDFFNRLSATAPGPALFSLKTGATIVFATSVLKKNGSYNIYFEEIKSHDLVGITSDNIRILTQRHAAKLEEKIRKWPDHWFWMHRRWKTPPPVEQVKNQVNDSK